VWAVVPAPGTTVEGDPMSRVKKGATRAAAGPARGGAGPARQRNVLALRGTEAWKAWLDGFAARKGMPVTVLVDHALRELAKRDGYPDPPARVP
jgi:hypothetical protein